jgi:hypothetical protein
MANVLSVTEDEAVTVALQRPNTTLVNRSRFMEGPEGTHIGVDITFSSPTLLFPYAFRNAQFAHRGLAIGIKDRLEGR